MTAHAGRTGSCPRRGPTRWLGVVCVALAAVGAAGQPNEPAETKATVIEGQVVNYFGAGVQGVQVTVTRRAEGTEQPPPLAATITNETGDFRLVVPEVISGAVTVAMTASGYAPATREVEIDPADELPPFVDVELAGSGVLAGTVHDARTDQPVAGANVTIVGDFRQLSAKSNEQGAFEIAGLLPGRVIIITDADRYGREQAPLGIAQGPGERTDVEVLADPRAESTTGISKDATGRLMVKLKPERVVHLRLEDGQHQPIAGVLVECLDEARQDFRTLAADAEGKLTIRGINYDTRALALRLAHEDYVSSDLFDRLLNLPADPLESTHILTMQPAGAIEGTITDRSTRQPLNGARVMVGRDANGRLPREWSDFEGAYRINGVPPGGQVVTVHLADHAPELFAVEVAAGQTTKLDVKLGPAAQVGGLVVTADGKPVPGVHVMATSWRDCRTLGLQAMTDQDGRFVIANAPADEFLVALRHPGYEQLDNQPVRPPKTDHTFTLQAGSGGGAMPPAKVNVGDQAPEFKLVTLDGQTLTLADCRGRTILLDFWATWCGPCVAELPELKNVHRDFGQRRDFAMIGVSLDDDERALAKFVETQKITWPQAVGRPGGAQQAVDAYGVFAIPATFLIGPDGKVIAKDLRGPGIKAELAKNLSQGRGPGS